MDERQRLAIANERAHIRMQEMRGVMRMQSDRIRELETNVIDEQKWTSVLHEQLQKTNDRLTRILRQVRDRTEGILAEYEVMIEEVVEVNSYRED